ncbi:MAG: DUF3168 domain-containing protein [Burkholderiales bacterium]|nr:DUF3168 domain-containing protein [Burkholderiales bacterium]
MTRSVEELIVSALKSVSALGGRVYPLVAEKGVAKPYAVLTIVSRTEDADFDGAINVADVYLQVDIYAMSPSESSKVSGECRAALRGIKETDCKTEHSEGQDTRATRSYTVIRPITEFSLKARIDRARKRPFFNTAYATCPY